MLTLDYKLLYPHDKVQYEFSGMINYKRAVILLSQFGRVAIPASYRLYNLIRNDPALVIKEAKWIKPSPFEQRQSPVLANDNTYEECVQIYLFADQDSIGIEISIWNGDTFNGFPTSRRSEYKCIITEYRAWIDSLMLQLLDMKAVRAVLEEEEIERLAKIALARDKILKNL